MVELRLGLINNIERKFIPTKKEYLKKYLEKLKKVEEYEIIQTYKGNIKYRCYNDNNKLKYTRNKKMEKITQVVEIDEDIFNKVLKENNNKCIRKIRKYYIDGDFEIDVDCFSEPINMVMIEVESSKQPLECYNPPKGFIEVTGNPIYENLEIFKGSIISNNTIIEGTDGVGKTSTIIELLKSGIICQDRCMDMISTNMLFDISINERANKYQKYLKNIDKKIIIMINNDREELQKRIKKRNVLSEFDELAYEYNNLYKDTYKYMEEQNMLENKIFLVDCTGLTIEEQVKKIKKIITCNNTSKN